MSAIIAPTNTQRLKVQWQSHVRVVIDSAIRRAETFTSVGTPPERNLGVGIVDEFAQDLRRLADA